MTNDERPRGDAAWRPAKQEVAKRNEAAYARGRKEREARDTARRKRHAAAERREFANLPHQPTAQPPAAPAD